MSDAIPAIILAGGKAKADILAATGVSNRALIPVNGRPMIASVVEALRSAPSIGELTVIGNLPSDPSCRTLPDTGDFVGNIFQGLDAVGDAEHALVSTVDIPFVTGPIVEDFVTHAREFRADLAYPIVQVEECYKRFPGVKRTALPTKEGKFTGGNMVLARVAFMRSHRERILQAYAARKSPLKLAMMLGLGTLVRVAAAMKVSPSFLTVGQLERAVGNLLEGTARAYVSPYPEIATDIDKLSDLEAISQSIQGR